MSTRELIAARAPTAEAIALAVQADFEVEAVEAAERDRVYYDTFDALLRAGGRSLVHEQGALSLLDRRTHETLAAEPVAQAPSEPVLGLDLPEGALRSAVLDVIDVRALLPLVRVFERTEPFRILDSLQKTVVRVSVSSPSLLSVHGTQTPLQVRLRLHSVLGYDEELERAALLLAGPLRLTEPQEPLVDEALRAAGVPPEGHSAKVDVPLASDQAADVAAAKVLRRLQEVMDDNLPGTLADTDSEFLHDYRVAVRRTRAVQRELAGVFEPGELAALRAGFRWLQQSTGDARDLDVYVLGFDSLRELLPESMRPDLDPLLSVLRGRRLIARREMTHALRSARAERVRADWEHLLEGLVEQPVADRPSSKRPIGEIASRRIRKVYRRMLEMGTAIDSDSPPADYHELRKKGKELRYLLELFGVPLHDEGVVKPMIRALKGLQDVLGRHQDREVQIASVRSLTEEVSTLPGGAGALMAMGVLIERLEADAAAARREFAESFATFSSVEQRRLVKRTFA